ncbi:cytochrome c3 family protein [Candidatus Saganbacteria bacterium]|nr:cytochrome c3 family protein [Candidatus Saganbacteria bacterium]
MGDGQIFEIFNKIDRALAIQRFPKHKGYLNDEDKCSACHKTTKPPEKGQPPLELWVPFFPHEKHDTCSDCHPSKDGKEFLPNKQNCLGCHDDDIHPETGTRCTNCHALPDDPKTGHKGQFPKHNPNGTTCVECHEIKDKKMARRPHPENWPQDHGKPGPIKKEQCGQCHDSSPKVKACATCHAKPSLAPESHLKTGRPDPNYRLFLHMLDARKKMIDCTSCHDTRTFCASCHASYKRMPNEHFAPNFMRAHGPQAKQDPEYCSACHGIGQRCFQCHPGGINKK